MTELQFFCRPLVDHHFGSQNTQQTAAHTSTLLRGLTMVHTCVVAGCRNRRTPGTTLSFYRFPRDPERKQRWIAAVNREGWVPNDGSRLCSTHFISGMKAKPLWTLKVSPCVGFLFCFVCFESKPVHTDVARLPHKHSCLENQGVWVFFAVSAVLCSKVAWSQEGQWHSRCNCSG